MIINKLKKKLYHEKLTSQCNDDYILMKIIIC